MKIADVAEVINQGGRTGKVETEDGALSISLHAPGEERAGATTPEHLFGAAYAACFHSAVLSAAERSHLKIEGSTMMARVSLKEDDRGGYYLGVELKASLPGAAESQAKHLLHLAHQSCPYSKAVRGNVEVELTLD